MDAMGTNKQKARMIFTAAVILLALFVVAGIWGINALVRYERQRDLNTWQITLNVMADTRANRVRQWVSAQFASLNELAENGSLQLYTQELLRRPDVPLKTEPAQLSYLRNLIRATAERNGFIDKSQTAPPVPANVAYQGNAGLALVSLDQTVITSTPGMPVLDSNLRKGIAQVAEDGKACLYDLFLNASGEPLVAFLSPVFALQVPSGGAKRPIAVLLGIKSAKHTLFPLLSSEENITSSDEALLVRRDGDLVTYVSPLADGTGALKRSLAANVNDLAAAYAVAHPGSFVKTRDYAGVEVLATSRALAGLPWVLVQKINTSEALRESKSHQRFLYLTMLLALAVVAALLLAAWFYGSSAREHQMTEKLLAKSQQLAAQTHLLNAINDNIKDYILLCDVEGKLFFANRALAAALGVTADDLSGKGLASVFGPATAELFSPLLRKALEKGLPVSQEIKFSLKGRQLQFHATVIPVHYRTATDNDAVLVSLHDVTLLREAQQKKADLLQQIVKALMRAIDLHDPYSANHSANTAKIALAIGQVMKLEPDAMGTLETAANLCNIGKLFLPKDLLAKTGPLTPEEQALLRQETDFAQKSLAGIDFEGPVLETIVQKNELLDGSGHPAGLKGDDIIQTARILAVANAFIAMISPRAYRNKLTDRDALDQFLVAMDTKYDRRVVAALFHVVENGIG